MSLGSCGLLRAEPPSKLEPALPLPLLLAEAAPAPAPVAAAAAPSPAPAAAAPPPPPGEPSLLPVPGAVAPRPAASLSENVTINLINRLVQRGALTQQDAADLIKLAEQDAQMARAQQQVLAETQAAVQMQQAAAVAPVPPAAEDEYRVTYVPETVKDQIRDQLKDEVLAQAKRENWAAPNEIPEWTRRIKIFGDIRSQYQGFTFPTGNDVSGVFPNFVAINSGAPFDTTGAVLAPQLNVNQNRNRMLMRARIGFDIDLEDGFTAGFRMASGQTNSPVSTNQAVGAVGGSGSPTGGNFSKYNLWLDRAFIKYQHSTDANNSFSFLVGRFDNPFFNVSELQWDEDVGFDGVAFKGRYEVSTGMTAFLNGGLFPIFNTDLNFPDNSAAKISSTDKYLYAAQVGFEFKPTKNIEAKFGAAYYYFQNVSGKLSNPYVPLNATDAGSTDNRRPLFAQKGNTYMPLRNITPTALNGFGTTNQFQYYGLASSFQNLALNGRIDFNNYEPLQVSLVGEYVKNLAFNKAAINSVAVNNRSGGGLGAFDGSDTAWYLGVTAGKPIFEKRGDWTTSLSYRYLGSDAVMDAFTDSNFGGGGTNMKGYTLSAAMALSRSARVGVSWMSASQAAGPTLNADVFMFDLSVRF